MISINKPSKLFNDAFAKWAEIVIRFRVIVLIGVLGLTLFFAWATWKHLIIENNFETFFSEGAPSLVEFQHFREIFGLKAFIFILVEAEDPLSLENMRLVDRLTEDLEENVPYQDKILGPTNAEILVGGDDRLDIFRLNENFEDPEEFKRLVDIFSKKKIYRNGLISADARHLGILMTTISRDKRATGGQEVTHATRKMTKAIYRILAKPEYKTLKLYPVGDPMFNNQFADWTNSETYRMFSWMVALLLVMLTVIFMRPRGVLIPVLTVVFTTVWTFGLLALNIKLRVTSSMLPPLLCAVGIADSIHILTEFDALMLAYNDRRKAVIETLRLVGYPCLLTSITTATGFLSLALAPVLPLQETGTFAAIGVIIAFVLTVTMVIAALSFGSDQPVSAKNKDASQLKSFRMMDGIFRTVDRNRSVTLIIWILLAIFFAVGLRSIIIDADWLRNFSEDVRIRQDYEYADSVMGGSVSFELLLDTGKKDGAKDPAFLARLDAFEKELLTKPGIIQVQSAVDLLKEVRKSLFNEQEAEYKPPESRQLAAQLMLLYSMAGGDTLDDLLDRGKQRVRVTIRTPFSPDQVLQDIRRNIRELLDKHFDLPKERIILTGYPVMGMALTELVLPSQFRSFGFAFIAIGILLIVFLRSLPLGLVGMIPTTLPVLAALGFMGWVGIKLDWVITMIASIGIGLSVDNAIHLFNRFRKEFDQVGNHRKAMQLALRHVGRALAFSCFILVIGFSICATSVMENVANFGRLSVLLIGVSFLAAVTLGPVLLVRIRPFGKDRVSDREAGFE